MTRMEALEAVALAARAFQAAVLAPIGSQRDGYLSHARDMLDRAFDTFDALPAAPATEPAPARGEVVEVAVWENINGDYFFIKPGRNSMGYGWTRLGTTRLPLTVEAPR